MATPAECHQPSPPPWPGLPEIDYPFHDKTISVTSCGRICVKRKKVNLSTIFARQKVGIRQVDDRLWLASFMTYNLGYFDKDTCRMEPIDNPFEKKCVIYVSGTIYNLSVQYKPDEMERAMRFELTT